MIDNKPIALICAAGVGARAGGDRPKQYQLILAEPMLMHTIRAFGASDVKKIIVVISPTDTWFDQCMDLTGFTKPIEVLRVGGASRAESVCHGLATLCKHSPDDWVMVHDAARPCLTAEMIDGLFQSLKNDDVGGILAIPVVDTVKQVHAGSIDSSVSRETLWLAQTPQMFRVEQLHQSLQHALAVTDTSWITDEASVMEHMGLKPQVIKGHSRNLKVTLPDDFRLAEFWLKQS